MRISRYEHTFHSFLEEIIDRGVEPGRWLRIACFIAPHSEWEPPERLIQLTKILRTYGAEIEKYGEIRKIVMRYYNRQKAKTIRVELFSYLHPETRLLMCFTTANKEDVDETIGKIAEETTGIYPLFIRSTTFEKLENMIYEAFPSTNIPYFLAYRIREFSYRGEIRPNYDRTIEYNGLDGRTTLKEFKQFYGVLPRIIWFNIPEFATYRIHSVGQFTVIGDGASPKKFLLEIIDFAVKDALLAREVVESASFELIPIRTEKKTFQFPKLTPWVIKFSSSIDYSKGEDLLTVLSNKNFNVFNHVLAEGSLRFNGMLTDEKKHCMFTIDANSERMVIAPIDEVPFDSFLRFYQTIVENFDPNASCEIFSE